MRDSPSHNLDYTLLWNLLKLLYNLGEEGVAHGIIQTNSKVVVASEELIPRKSLFTFFYKYGLIEIICTLMKISKGVYTEDFYR